MNVSLAVTAVKAGASCANYVEVVALNKDSRDLVWQGNDKNLG